MVKKQKLFQKVLNSPKNVRFDEFVLLLTAFGFREERISGSHHIFKHPDVKSLLSIQPGRQGEAKPYQIRQFLKLIEEYDLQMLADE